MTINSECSNVCFTRMLDEAINKAISDMIPAISESDSVMKCIISIKNDIDKNKGILYVSSQRVTLEDFIEAKVNKMEFSCIPVFDLINKHKKELQHRGFKELTSWLLWIDDSGALLDLKKSYIERVKTIITDAIDKDENLKHLLDFGAQFFNNNKNHGISHYLIGSDLDTKNILSKSKH